MSMAIIQPVVESTADAEDRAERLAKEFQELLEHDVRSIRRKAEIILELEQMGRPLLDRRVPFYHYLCRIANGNMLPEVLLEFGYNAELLHKVSQLSIQEQRKLVGGEKPKLFFYTEDGKLDHKLVDLKAISKSGHNPSRVLAQIFDKDHIRTDAEQSMRLLEWTAKKSEKQSHKRVRANVGGCYLDWERKGIDVPRKTFISLADLEEMVKRLRA